METSNQHPQDPKAGPTLPDLLLVSRSLYRWTSKALTSLYRRKHLPKWEFGQISDFLLKQLDHLDRVNDNYAKLKALPGEISVDRLIDALLEDQAEVNTKALFYELSPFALPEHIQQPPDYSYRTFQVFTDWLRPIAWVDYEIRTRLIHPPELPKDNDMIVVCHRPIRRQARKYSLGWSGGFSGRTFILKRNHPRMAEPLEDMEIRRSVIVRFFKVDHISFDVEKYEASQKGGQANE